MKQKSLNNTLGNLIDKGITLISVLDSAFNRNGIVVAYINVNNVTSCNYLPINVRENHFDYEKGI